MWHKPNNPAFERRKYFLISSYLNPAVLSTASGSWSREDLIRKRIRAFTRSVPLSMTWPWKTRTEWVVGRTTSLHDSDVAGTEARRPAKIGWFGSACLLGQYVRLPGCDVTIIATSCRSTYSERSHRWVDVTMATSMRCSLALNVHLLLVSGHLPSPRKMPSMPWLGSLGDFLRLVLHCILR